ncbi:hypothetical protein BWQ96_09981 [Gracilariopsis chorda]|uniref:Chromatin modification-related protein MEAF6 n=1 Tax=Gracilariopsis chorda TaxID=448386 RepID=A0A2V3IE12_9FLOR|nr:hypothetical protein BWQ96_09981 [Gracilariopsis chorda]|eukprot:PXF40325.1 hypothetical protein BWQ96_09981 [Gracilariopsis chorda]
MPLGKTFLNVPPSHPANHAARAASSTHAPSTLQHGQPSSSTPTHTSPSAMPRKTTHRPLAAKAPRGLGISSSTASSSQPQSPAPARSDTKKSTSTKQRAPTAGKSLIEKPRNLAENAVEKTPTAAIGNTNTSTPTVTTVASSTRKAADTRASKSVFVKAERAAERAAEKAAIAAERAALQQNVTQQITALEADIERIETDIARMEEDYIKTTWAQGNVLRGWDGFGRRVDRTERTATGNGSGVATGAPKHRKSRPNDRIFSLSSSTSSFRKENPDVQIARRSTVQKKKKKR